MQRTNTVWFHLHEISRIGKVGSRVPRAGGGGDGELLFSGHRAAVRDGGEVLKLAFMDVQHRDVTNGIKLYTLTCLPWQVLCYLYIFPQLLKEDVFVGKSVGKGKKFLDDLYF